MLTPHLSHPVPSRIRAAHTQESQVAKWLSSQRVLFSSAALGECPGLDSMSERGGQWWTELSTRPEEPKVQAKWDNNQETTQLAGCGGTYL